MKQTNHVISIDESPEIICKVISDFVNEAMNQVGYCTLQHQIKLYQTNFEGTNFVD